MFGIKILFWFCHQVALLTILRTCLGLDQKIIGKNPIRSISESGQILPLIDCLDSKNRVALAREILESIPSRNPNSERVDSVSPDPDSILYLAGILADSVNAQTIQGRWSCLRQASKCDRIHISQLCDFGHLQNGHIQS